MPLFGKSSKNPGEVVRQLKESLMVLEKQHNGDSQKKFEKAHDDVRNCPSYFETLTTIHSLFKLVYFGETFTNYVCVRFEHIFGFT